MIFGHQPESRAPFTSQRSEGVEHEYAAVCARRRAPAPDNGDECRFDGALGSPTAATVVRAVRALDAARAAGPQAFDARVGAPAKQDAGMKLSVVVLCSRGKFGWSPLVVTTAIEV